MTDDELRRSELGLGLREDAAFLGLQAEEPAVVLAPQKVPETPGEWIRQNLFSGVVSSAITVAAGAVVAFALYQIVRFLFVAGDWEIVRSTLDGYMVGSFPDDELWRVWACVYLVAALSGLSLGISRWRLRLSRRRGIVGLLILGAVVAFLAFAVKTALVLGLIAVAALTLAAGALLGRVLGRDLLRKPLIIAWALAFPIAIVIVRFIGDGVAPRFWEGFFFNVIAATVGIFASFPIGIALALGRRSDLPAIRTFSITFIEIFRGVPLVAWLVFSKYVVDLVLPPQIDLPDIIKAFIAMTLFSAAYIAEIVRGGLQGVHEGQFEAARALGLPTTRLMALVVLPQALRSTIPAMISHFISLFKDTSLFVAIEWTDLLEAARRSGSNPEFLGNDMEALLFAALIFWMVAFSMGRWSQRLELRLGVGER